MAVWWVKLQLEKLHFGNLVIGGRGKIEGKLEGEFWGEFWGKVDKLDEKLEGGFGDKLEVECNWTQVWF